ncbi:hypothetical protein ILYODFUR_037230 [Ilyodon furcidens]|uniref:Uncharacterized protein n=1 Tax=Ilyodon furcidens TaxID=33524 RepID=A0ABV0SUW6_9TELE
MTRLCALHKGTRTPVFGHWGQAGCFPEHWYFLKVKAQVEDVMEKFWNMPSTLRAEAVRSSSFPLLEPLQLSPHLASCNVESRRGAGGYPRVHFIYILRSLYNFFIS